MNNNYNPDTISMVDALYFPTVREALRWVVSEYGRLVEEFVSPPIEIDFHHQEEKEKWPYRLVDRYQSGNCLYRWKQDGM